MAGIGPCVINVPRNERTMNHKLDCWKIVAFYELGVGGPFASCTCGVDREQSGDQMSAVAPTNDSQSITPDELRKSCRQVRARPQGLRLDPDVVEAAADAWDHDNYAHAVEVAAKDLRIEELSKRLEAATAGREEYYRLWHRDAERLEAAEVVRDACVAENTGLYRRLEAAEKGICTCGARTAIPHNPWCPKNPAALAGEEKG